MCTRAILDAFWSHSSRTVAGHVREVKLISKYADRLGILSLLPRLGPFPWGHHMEMLQALLAIMRSMESGNGNDGMVKLSNKVMMLTEGSLLDCVVE